MVDRVLTHKKSYFPFEKTLTLSGPAERGIESMSTLIFGRLVQVAPVPLSLGMREYVREDGAILGCSWKLSHVDHLSIVGRRVVVDGGFIGFKFFRAFVINSIVSCR